MPTPPQLPPSYTPLSVTPAIEYAVPAAYAPSSSCYREGALIVTPVLTRLPPGCVKCGEPESLTLTKKLSWHHPALFLLIVFPGLLIYALIALVVRKQGTATFGLCERHASGRRRRMWIGAIGALGSIAVGIAGMILAENRTIDRDSGPIVLIVGILAMIAFLIVWLTALPVLKPKLIDAFQMKLGGAGALPRHARQRRPDGDARVSRRNAGVSRGNARVRRRNAGVESR